MLITKGGAETRIEGVVLHSSAGMLVVHPVGMVHEIRYSRGTEGTTITVAKSFVDALTKDDPRLLGPLDVPAVIELGEAFGVIQSSFEEILTETRLREAGWAMAVRGQFLALLVRLHRLHHRQEKPERPRRDLQLAMGLRGLVEQHFREEKRMDFYADQLAISPQRLNAACNSALGKSASAILHDRLMIEARRLLAYTELSIAEIGHDLGFDDPAYFNRFFARRAGSPPGAWRETYSATQRVEKDKSVE